MMGLHKLTAGDGYLYLIRQVAAGDATDRGRPSLADYYSSKGETPGRWMGRGLPAAWRAGQAAIGPIRWSGSCGRCPTGRRCAKTR